MEAVRVLEMKFESGTATGCCTHPNGHAVPSRYAEIVSRWRLVRLERVIFLLGMHSSPFLLIADFGQLVPHPFTRLRQGLVVRTQTTKLIIRTAFKLLQLMCLMVKGRLEQA